MNGRSSVSGVIAALAVAATFATATPALSQTQDERDVIAVVQKMFDAMAGCDEATARAISMPEGRLYRLSPGTEDPVRSSTFEEFGASLGKCGRKMLERMWAPQVRVHKGIATLWAPYDFWLDGAFSHCGIDSFELAKTADGWKFTSGIYTVERTGCAPSPLGPPPSSGAGR
jgi:hypothetical protein